MGDWLRGLAGVAGKAATDEGALFGASEEGASPAAIQEETEEYSTARPAARISSTDAADIFWEQVLSAMLMVLQTAMTEKEFAQSLQITSAQAKAWLKRAVSEGKVVKKAKPVRYIAARSTEQTSLFPHDI